MNFVIPWRPRQFTGSEGRGGGRKEGCDGWVKVLYDIDSYIEFLDVKARVNYYESHQAILIPSLVEIIN